MDWNPVEIAMAAIDSTRKALELFAHIRICLDAFPRRRGNLGKNYGILVARILLQETAKTSKFLRQSLRIVQPIDANDPAQAVL